MDWMYLSLYEGGIATVLVVLFFLQLIYLIFYGRFYRYATKNTRQKEMPETYPPVSVILSVHNEAELLRNHLPRIMNQEYPDFEVVIVNNTSTDDTEEVITLFKNQYPNLHYTFVPVSSRNPSNKKLAISMGIKASKHEWMVFTEPGCIPQSPYWLKYMARNFSSKTEVVLGYSRYQKEKGYFATKVRLLNFLIQIRFLTSALTGHPFMGYGRNMAYRKSLFFTKKGFSGHLNLKRGEDDLLVNKVATRTNTRVELSPESILTMPLLPTPRQWNYEQHDRKKTYRLLKSMQPTFWSIETFTRFLFLLCANVTLAYSLIYSHWVLAGIAFLLLFIRFLFVIILTSKIGRTLQESQFKLSLFFLSGIQFSHILRSYKLKINKDSR